MEEFKTWRDARVHAETLSDQKTTAVQCPRCLAKPDERCVTSKLKPTSIHVDRNERAVFMQEWSDTNHQKVLKQAAERQREARIAAGLTPETHPPECFCDEECWPRKQEEAEGAIEYAKVSLDMYRQRLTQAEADLDVALVNESRMAIERDAWLRR